MPKVVLTTGGTGGHIFPALAVAEVLRQKGYELLFMGGTYGQEEKLAAKAGIPFIGLKTRGFLGRGLRAIPAAFDLCAATLAAIRKVKSFMPCAVAAFGGYASLAPSLAAIFLRIPLLLHEQNAMAGMSNRILSRMAARLCASLPETSGFKKPFVVTGNPVRQGVLHVRDSLGDTGKHLLVLGGSQGAHALNVCIASLLPAFKKLGIELRHQTGEKDYKAICEAYAEAGYDPECVSPFIEDMAAAYGWADLAFCRAGASTIAELCIAGLPSVLVPFPAAIHDHQTYNAKALAEVGAAVLLPETELASAGDILISLLGNHAELGKMSRVAESLGQPDAAGNVALEIENLCSSQS